MKFNRILLFCRLIIALLFVSLNVLGQNIRKVIEIPVEYASGIVKDKPWIVYSDRNNNPTYKDAKMTTTFKPLNFLESFYVVNVDKSKHLLELIKYAPDLLDSNSVKIKSSAKIEYCGWIAQNNLIVSPKAFEDKGFALKWVTMLNDKKIFAKMAAYTENGRIKLHDGPELQKAFASALNFEELVYVYKIIKDNSGDKYLIGRKTTLNPKNATDNIIGWVPSTFVQLWGTRLCADPLIDLSNNANLPLVYTTKDACLAGNGGSSYTMNPPKCEQELFWNKYPVLKIEEIKKNNSNPYIMLHTGAITTVFDKSASFIYSDDKTKINYTTLCDIYKASKNVNVVIAVNAGADKKKYLPALTSLVQELPVFFNNKRKNDLRYQFAAIDCSVAGAKRSDFTDQCSNLLPTLQNIVQKNAEVKNTAFNSGIGNGLASAAALFKGHEEETNVIIIISSKPDVDTKLLKESLYADLAQKNVRLLLLQPYCESDPTYTNFLPQAQTIIENTGSKGIGYKINKLANNVGVIDPSKSVVLSNVIKEGVNNILYFPTDANTEGLFVYPTIDSTINTKCLNITLDTLFNKIETDNIVLLTALKKMFNSSLCVNNKLNKTFQQFYKTQDSIPTNIITDLNNTDYNYFIDGYTMYPKNIKPFKFSLLLSADEYTDLYSMFKSLNLERIRQQGNANTSVMLYQQLSKLLADYKTRNHITSYIDNLTFNQYFYMLFGFYSDNELLNKYKVYDLNNSAYYLDMKYIFDYIYNRAALYYSLQDNTNFMFSSNGTRYYWVPENYLP